MMLYSPSLTTAKLIFYTRQRKTMDECQTISFCEVTRSRIKYNFFCFSRIFSINNQLIVLIVLELTMANLVCASLVLFGII